MKVYIKRLETGGIVIRYEPVDVEGYEIYELKGNTIDEVEQELPALLTQIKGE